MRNDFLETLKDDVRVFAKNDQLETDKDNIQETDDPKTGEANLKSIYYTLTGLTVMTVIFATVISLLLKNMMGKVKAFTSKN